MPLNYNKRVLNMGKKELTYNVYLQRRDNREALASRSFDDYDEAVAQLREILKN